MTTVPVTNPRSNILKLRASTIFECSYGTLGKSEEMGRLLVATERECGEPYHLSHALRIASVPLRRSGSRTEAEAMLAESLEISLRFRHAGSAAVTLDLLASLALERGDTEQARAHLDRIATLRDGLQEPLLLESVSRLELKYALVTGSAGNSTEVFLSPHHDSLRRAAETTAINCLIAARRSRLEHGQIDEMMLTHEKTRQFGGQDLVTNIVIGALIESGHDDRARSLLIDYLRIRRERFSFYLSPSLTLGRLALP